jgi:hypothetical protein
MSVCAQCGTYTPELGDYPPYGLLCQLCAHRQYECDEGAEP